VLFRSYDELYGEKVISAQQLDHARGQLDVARAGVTLAEKQLAEARSGLNQVNILMGYHALRSPISGVVAARFIDPGDTSSAEKAAFLVNRQERVKVTGAVPEKAFPKLRLGQEGTVLLDALGGKPAKAKIARLAPAIDPVTRTGQAELVLDASKDLKPGMFGRVVIQVGTHEGLAVPREAVQSLAGTGERRVFVNKEGLAQSRTVKTGVEEKDWIEILDGLAVNDQVVLTQSARIGEGSPLEVTNP
jgi:RND family efflux transporter MFP subunit